MYIANVTYDYDKITSSNYTDILNDYENITSTTDTINCTNNIDIIIPSLLIIPCGLSFLCLLSLMLYTLIKPIFNKK